MTPGHGLLGLSLSLRFRFIHNASLLALHICATTQGPAPGSFLVPCHCSYIFVSFLAFHVHVAGDLNKAISFVVGILSTSFARALLGFIR